MDEESLVAADRGGIDARHISEFDEWLLADPAHLEQVLPERRGVVVLVPRRNRDRNYGDLWTQGAAMLASDLSGETIDCPAHLADLPVTNPAPVDR